LPCIAGRDFSGQIVKAPRRSSRFVVGDKILGVATDYRDSRRSAFQQYAVVSDFNAARLPPNISPTEAAALGVAFVASALALGVCLGMDLLPANGGPRGIDLLQTTRSLPRESLPADIRAECFDGIREQERAKKGDWIVIWGGKICVRF
jgi:NADPH:quinone reductase-like Zn-dependent oxidoreductase